MITPLCISQNIYDACPVDEIPNPQPESYHSYSTNEIDKNIAEPKVINVFFWKVTDPQGEYGGKVFNTNKVLNTIATLNMYYNEFNIFFKYKGNDVIPNTPADLPLEKYEPDPLTGIYDCIEYPGQFDPNGYGIIGRCQYGQFFNWVESAGYKEDNAMNIYVPYGSEFGGAASDIPGDKIILKTSKLDEAYTPVHEMGHALGLYHTRSSSENVTREEFLDPPHNTLPNPDFNAKTHGDRVVDTAANPGFHKGGAYTYIDENCAYISGDEQDSTGTDYMPTPEDVANALSDAYICAIDPIISNGQAHRMREKINNAAVLAPTLTTIASLFEPYQGGYTTIPQTIAPPLFQPGFDYVFRPCCCDYPLPSDYNDVSFNYSSNNEFATIVNANETDYSSINHPNHKAIQIKQLSTFMANPVRKCWDRDGFATSGRVTQFNDGVFNNNVTVTEKDEAGINDPNLVNDLPAGLYAIDKEYPDGTTDQEVVQKGNN